MRQQLPKLLITGGAGFIGSAFVRNYAAGKKYRLVVVDKLTYAGDKRRLKSVADQINFYKADICNGPTLDEIFQKERPSALIHFAAETHVDRSILDASSFIKTNIQGTANLIELALKYKLKRFVHISTDEVYGEIKKGAFTEDSPIQPNNPYSATKAGADMLIKAAVRTHKLPGIIVRPCNNYGPWQYPEKFIPVIMLKAFNDQKIPLYGKGLNVREWLYVDDCARAIYKILAKGKIGEIYNISSGEERKNIQVIKSILSILKKPSGLIQYVKDRPGHDLRYASDCRKLKKLGWKEEEIFETGLEKTILWAEENFSWIESKLCKLNEYWKKVYKD